MSQVDDKTTADETLPDAVKGAIAHLQSRSPAPATDALVTELLTLEKTSKRNKQRYDYAQLLGNWRLGFTTGTVKTRKRAGTTLGAGRFLPRFLDAQIRYAADAAASNQGTVYNTVKLANLTLQLQGPTLFWPKTNSLAFDFTHLCIFFNSFRLYQRPIRGGQAQTEKFFTETLKTQAFFTYFLVTPTCLAARGRGGGLALWTRSADDDMTGATHASS